ncbi:MAG TPA: hypothetical protein VEA61_00025 [Allosphingosinicella sp.]|nr:hypothetical protein [Allosphingosinicella sp.]
MRILIVLALLVFSGISASDAQIKGGAEPEIYKIEMQLFKDGRVFATPKVTMREGGTTIMTVDRPGGYSMRVRLTRAREATAPPQRLTVASEIFLQRDGRWVPVGTPTVMVPLGREARMEIAPSASAEGFKGTFAMTVLVTQGAAMPMARRSKLCDSKREAFWMHTMQQPAKAKVHLAQIPPRVPCCSSGCVTCCGEQACCFESTVCNACCCN